MIDKTFAEELAAKYQNTTDGNWHVVISHGMGETHNTILTDKPTAMSGKHIGSFGEFGNSNAEFCAFCHENMYRILDLIEACGIHLDHKKRGLI